MTRFRRFSESPAACPPDLAATGTQFAERIRVMGEALGSVYSALVDDLVALYGKWTIFRELYATSAARVELLNRAAEHFFGIVQHALVDDVMLHIARLTDRPKVTGKDTLTVRRLPDLIADENLRAEIADLVSRALAACKAIRVRRNQQLAHSDLVAVFSTDLMPGIARSELETALASLAAVLNRLELHYWQSTRFYEDVITPLTGGELLVRRILDGVRAAEERQRRIRDGDARPEDYRLEALP